MPYFLKGNCVHKGTKEEPGEQIKCHDTYAEAVAHMRALYANVDDAAEKLFVDVDGEWYEFVRDKGGPGSGWHRPPRGTHNAENAPNFRGGPGADRTYGTEEEEPPEGSKLCKCVKCDSVFTLPKGKQCKDVECPGCGGRAEQTSPRTDKPAEGEEGRTGGGKKEVECPACEEEKAMDGPGTQVHGEGGSLGEVASVMGEDRECRCPECKKGVSCNAKTCPHCEASIDKVERMESDKRSFVSYKSADDQWRWLSISNWAVVDREAEVVTEKAYRDAIAHAQKSGRWGELDLVHVNGTDVGDCDMMFIVKAGEEPAKLGAGGTWHDSDKATRVREALQAKPDYWGMSVKFRYNPARYTRGIYTGDIQVLKHTILPREMAASYGTAITVQGGDSMSKVLDEKTQDALRNLNISEDEIAELAEKQKDAPPEEENVVEKEESTEAEPQEEQGLIEKIRQLIKGKPEAPVASEPEEAESDKEVTPAETPEEVEAEKAGADEPEMNEEVLKAMAAAIVTPMAEALSAELEKRDAQIAELAEQVKALSVPIEEKVEARLRDVPPVVKVAASQVGATVAADTPASGNSQVKALVDSIVQAGKDTYGGAKYQA